MVDFIGGNMETLALITVQIFAVQQYIVALGTVISLWTISYCIGRLED